MPHSQHNVLVGEEFPAAWKGLMGHFAETMRGIMKEWLIPQSGGGRDQLGALDGGDKYNASCMGI